MCFKYNIGHYISLLPDAVYPKDVVEQLSQYGISKSEYLRDKCIKRGDERVVPKERLVIYAKVLGVSIESLENS